MALTTASHHSFQRAHRVDQGVQVGPVNEYVDPVPVMTDITYLLEPPVPPVLTEYVAPAHAVTYAVPAPVIDYLTPGPAVTKTAPAPVIEYVPDDTYAAPAPVIQYVALTPATCAALSPLIKHVTFAPDDTPASVIELNCFSVSTVS